MAPEWLRAGVVGRPHGLDGSFHVTQASPELLAVGVQVRVGDAERPIERRAGSDGRPIVRLEGCNDRAGAEALRGAELFVARTQAPELGPDEWWAEDLEGCTVRDGERLVGTVSRLIALPSCEVLEVERSGVLEVERSGEPLLVPLISDAVRTVDLDARTIDVDLRFLGEE